MNRQDKYSYEKIEKNKTYVWHTEGDTKTLIAITDTAEKAHFLMTAANKFSGSDPEGKEVMEFADFLKPFEYSAEGDNYYVNNNPHGIKSGYYTLEQLYKIWKQNNDNEYDLSDSQDQELRELRSIVENLKRELQEKEVDIERLKKDWKVNLPDTYWNGLMRRY